MHCIRKMCVCLLHEQQCPVVTVLHCALKKQLLFGYPIFVEGSLYVKCRTLFLTCHSLHHIRILVWHPKIGINKI